MEIDWSQVGQNRMFLACMQEIHECQKCGRCCRGMAGIAMTRLDTKKMANHLGMKERDFIDQYTTASPRKPSDRLYRTVGPEERCPFQGEDGGCTQYEGRGQVCRFYPFASPENMVRGRDAKGVIIYDRCRGMALTYLHVLEGVDAMPPQLADAMLKSETGKLLFLKIVDMEGRGEAYIKKRLKALGLVDWPEEDIMKTMAYQYAVAYCTKLAPEARENLKRELNAFLTSH